MQAPAADRRRTDHRDRCYNSGADPWAAARITTKYNTAIIFITHDLGVIAQWRTMSWSCISAGSWKRVRWTTSSTRRCIPTPRRCCARSPAFRRRSQPRCQSLPVRCRIRSTVPPAVPSIRAVMTLLRARARPRSPALHGSGPRRAARCLLHSDAAEPAMTAPLLDVRGLRKFFPSRRAVCRRVTGHVRAVDDVSFTVQEGEALGLVGESGCWQDHDRALHSARDRSDRGAGPVSTRDDAVVDLAPMSARNSGRCAKRSR